MHTRELFAGLLNFSSYLLRLLFEYSIICQVSKRCITILGSRSVQSSSTDLLDKASDLVLQLIVLLSELVVFLFDSQVMLNLLCLVVVANRHLLVADPLNLFL